MKVVFTILVALISLNSNGQSVIHADPYDIRKLNTCFSFFVGEFKAVGSQLRISYYPKPKLQLVYNWYQSFPFFIEKSPNAIGAFLPAMYMSHELESDIHITDKTRRKDMFILIDKQKKDKNTVYEQQAKVNSLVRRIFAITPGLEYLRKNVLFFDEPDGPNVKARDLKSDKDIIFNERKENNGVVTIENAYNQINVNANFINLNLGIKYKSMAATGIDSTKRGRKGKNYKDNHFETFISIVLPLNHTFDPYLYDKKTGEALYRIYWDQKPTPGFKLGFFLRNCIKTGCCFGMELGKNPNMGPRPGGGFYLRASLGLSLNWGKINEATHSKK